jgi:hypothetical protein
VNEVGAVFTVRLPRRRAAPPQVARDVAESDGHARVAVDITA